MGRVDIDYVKRVALSAVRELPNTKNPMPMRQKGNRLITAMAKNIKEDVLAKDPVVDKLISNMSLDTNYIIR